MGTAVLDARPTRMPSDLAATLRRSHAAVVRALVALTVSVSSAAQGQASDSFPPWGHRVRITAPAYGMNRLPARFRGIRRDTLLADADTALYVPVESIQLLEASRGKSAVPVIVGAILGAAAGVAIGAEIAPECGLGPLPLTTADFSCGSPGAIMLGMGFGAFAGAGVGVALRTERWRAVDLGDLSGPAQAANGRIEFRGGPAGMLYRLRFALVPTRQRGALLVVSFGK